MITITFRRLAAGASVIAVASVTAVAAPAAMADHTQRLDIGAELVRQPSGKPWIVNLNIGAELGMADGSVPEPVNHMRFSFTRGAKVHPEAFATCTMAILEAKGPSGCPTTSKLGTGKAIAAALEDTFPADVTVFNGPGTKAGRKILIYARALGTVVIPLTGTLTKSSGQYGWILDLPVQRIQTVGDNDASITSFQVKVGGTGRKGVPFIEAPTSCTKPGWPFLGEFSYADGGSGSSSAIIPCLLKATNND
jgi:hypothetical protein